MSAWDPSPKRVAPGPESEERQRARLDDARALRELLDRDDLSDREREAFEGMAEDVARRQRPLTDRQREWVRGTCERLGVQYGDPAERNRDVPAGRAVATPAVLLNLPKRPPGRRVG